MQRLQELRHELATRNITLAVARARLSLTRAFNPSWVAQRLPATGLRRFPTLKAAVHAFEHRELDADAGQAAAPPSPLGKADAAEAG